MTTRRAILAFAALGLAFASRAEAKTAEPPRVKFYVASFPPYAYLDRGDGASGFFVDLVRAMAPHAGSTGTLDVVPWKRAQHELLQLKDQYAKLIFPLIRVQEREAHYRWVAELYVDDIVLFLRKDEPRPVATLADARGLKIAVVGGSALLNEVKADPKHEVNVCPDIESCAKLLNARRVDAWYVSRWVGEATMRHLKIDPAELRVPPAFRRLSIYLGASLETPDVTVQAWAKAFDVIKADGTYDKLLEKWKGGGISP